MKPSLIIHIGAAKCGSSAIQALLAVNRGELLKQNILVPDENLRLEGPFSGNQIWLFEYLLKDVDENREVLRRRLHALLDRVHDKKNSKIIISAENLSNRHGFHHLFAGLGNDFDIRVIFYIRRQDDYLISSWQQWYVKKYPDFWTWVLYSINRKGQWYKELEPWIETFGKEAITVRRFARDYLKDRDLLKDFAEVVALDSSNINFNIGMRNPSYSDTVTELAHSIQDIFKDIHDNEFYEMIVNWAGSAAFKEEPSQLLSAQQRHAVMDCYRDSNNKIKKEFFPELGQDEELFGPLRSPPRHKAEHSTVDPHVAMLTRLIYGNYREMTVLRKSLKAKAVEQIAKVSDKLKGR